MPNHSEREYSQPMHWHCGGRSVSRQTNRRGCKDSDCPSKKNRKALTNRLRRAYSKRIVRTAFQEA